METTRGFDTLEANGIEIPHAEKRAHQLLLKCFEEYMKRSGNAEITLSALCTQMMDQHNVSPETTSIELDELESEGKVIKSEIAGDTTYRLSAPKVKKSRPDAAPPLDEAMREISSIISRCVKTINARNNNLGASYDEILDWMQSNNAPEDLTKPELQKYLDREVLYVKLKRNEAGLYLLAKKRGRPFGTGCLKKTNKTPNSATKRHTEERKMEDMGKRKRIRKSYGDFDFYDTPSNSSLSTTQQLCDFCLKTSSSNKFGVFEELLICKDCSAKAHPSCMQYSDILSTRARLSPWQCIDCKTCSMCLDAGNPDDLLFCDACDKGYHMSCHDPPVREKPTNKWACNSCLADGVNVDDLVSASSDGERSASANDNVFMPSSSASTTNCTPFKDIKQLTTNRSISNCSSIATTARSPSPASLYKNTLPASTNQWTVTQVAQYVKECGFLQEALVFEQQEIDGKSLLLLLREDVIKNMAIKLGPALKIYERIKLLQNCNGKSHGRL